MVAVCTVQVTAGRHRREGAAVGIERGTGEEEGTEGETEGQTEERGGGLGLETGGRRGTGQDRTGNDRIGGVLVLLLSHPPSW